MPDFKSIGNQKVADTYQQWLHVPRKEDGSFGDYQIHFGDGAPTGVTIKEDEFKAPGLSIKRLLNGNAEIRSDVADLYLRAGDQVQVLGKIRGPLNEDKNGFLVGNNISLSTLAQAQNNIVAFNSSNVTTPVDLTGDNKDEYVAAGVIVFPSTTVRQSGTGLKIRVRHKAIDRVGVFSWTWKPAGNTTPSLLTNFAALLPCFTVLEDGLFEFGINALSTTAIPSGSKLIYNFMSGGGF